MPTDATAWALSGLIQTSLAPIFLLTAISATLMVIDTRLNRIIDRVRNLEASILADPRPGDGSMEERAFYIMRARQIGWSISLCTLAALCVAVMVVILYTSARANVILTSLTGTVFTAAILLYAAALVNYLRDVRRVNQGLNFIDARITLALEAAK